MIQVISGSQNHKTLNYKTFELAKDCDFDIIFRSVAAHFICVLCSAVVQTSNAKGPPSS